MGATCLSTVETGELLKVFSKQSKIHLSNILDVDRNT